jgi:hypothetical protein
MLASIASMRLAFDDSFLLAPLALLASSLLHHSVLVCWAAGQTALETAEHYNITVVLPSSTVAV